MRGSVLVLALLLAGCGGGSSHAATTSAAGACRGPDLRGAFSVVRGSAGAGQITYRLRVVDRSSSDCFVSGIPGLRLLGANGKALPTHARAEHPAQLTAVRVLLRPGGAAALTARFSPDVHGPGEQHPGRCEPVADRLRVTPQGGGSVVVPVRPPTSVCEHGRLGLTAFAPG